MDKLRREGDGDNFSGIRLVAATGRDLDWEKVILSGASHGSTSAARLAKEIKVARVVMLSEPRDQTEK